VFKPANEVGVADEWLSERDQVRSATVDRGHGRGAVETQVGDDRPLAVRIGILSDSTAVARKIGTVHRVIVASPVYLSRAGTPLTPADLIKHTLIVGPAGGSSEGWSFRRDGKTTSVRVQGRLVINATEAATAAAIAGLGIFSTGERSIRAELESGALVRVLPDWEIGSSDINVILPAGRAAKASARAFADFVAAQVHGS
jgi:DNA-binding transcriptional LysR family regulator